MTKDEVRKLLGLTKSPRDCLHEATLAGRNSKREYREFCMDCGKEILQQAPKKRKKAE